MRRIVYGLLALIIIAAGLFFLLAPGRIESGLNKVVATRLPPVTPRAGALHARIAVADMHADTLLWQRDLLEAADRGQVDLPRLEAGNVALQIFSSVTKTPKRQNYDANGADTDNITLLAVAQLQPPRTWRSLLERSLWHAEKARRAEARSGGRLRIVASGADVRRLLADRAAGPPISTGSTPPASGWPASRISSTMR